MALHSSTSFASLELYNKSLQGSPLGTSITLFRPQEAFLRLSRPWSRYVNRARRSRESFLSVAASADSSAAIFEEAKLDDFQTRLYRMPTMHSMVDPQPFKIIPVEQGGLKNWHPAKVLNIKEPASGVRVMVIEAEISREMVSLENAYTAAGRLAQLKPKEDAEIVKVVASSSPFPQRANDAVLIKSRCDIPSGMTKQPQYFLSVKHPLELILYEAETPQLFTLTKGDEVELGPFDYYSGLDLRPILFLTRYPTILFFASGKGIAVAKAIIEARDNDAGSMSLGRREAIRLFYWSPDPSQVLFKEKFGTWENEKLKVRPAVEQVDTQDWDGFVGSFTSLWDEDDIEYDPSTTGVIVSVDPSSAAEVDELLEMAGIPEKQILRWNPSLNM